MLRRAFALPVGGLALVLSQLDYPQKDHELVGVPDPLIVGPAARVHEDDEDPARFFPPIGLR